MSKTAYYNPEYFVRGILKYASMMPPNQLATLEQLALKRENLIFELVTQLTISDDFYFKALAVVIAELDQPKQGYHFRPELDERLHFFTTAAYTPERRLPLLQQGKDKTLGLLVMNWRLNLDEMELLKANEYISEKTISKALKRNLFHKKDAHHYIEQVMGVDKLRFLLENQTDYSDQQLEFKIEDAHNWLNKDGNSSTSTKSDLLAALLLKRPHLLNSYAGSTEEAVLKNAASSELLLQRPELVTKIYESSMSPKVSFQFNVQIALTLAHNLHVKPDDLEKLRPYLKDLYSRAEKAHYYTAELKKLVATLEVAIDQRQIHPEYTLTKLGKNLDDLPQIENYLTILLESASSHHYSPYTLFLLASNPNFHQVKADLRLRTLNVLTGGYMQEKLSFITYENYQQVLTGILEQLSLKDEISDIRKLSIEKLIARDVSLQRKNALTPATKDTAFASHEKLKTGFINQVTSPIKSKDPITAPPNLAEHVATVHNLADPVDSGEYYMAAAYYIANAIPNTTVAWDILIEISKTWQGTIEQLVQTTLTLV